MQVHLDGFDQNRHSAFVVRVPLPRNQQVEGQTELTHTFPFSRYKDGEAGALKAAKTWRDSRAKRIYGEVWRERMTQARYMPRQKKTRHLDQEAGICSPGCVRSSTTPLSNALSIFTRSS